MDGWGFGLDPKAIASFVAKVAEEVPGCLLNVECPADFGTLEKQLDGYAAIVAEMQRIILPRC